MENNYDTKSKEYRKLSRELNFLKHSKMMTTKVLAKITGYEYEEIEDSITHGKKAIPYDKLKEVIEMIKDGKEKRLKAPKIDSDEKRRELASNKRDEKFRKDFQEYLKGKVQLHLAKELGMTASSIHRLSSGGCKFSSKPIGVIRPICIAMGKQLEDYILESEYLTDVDDCINASTFKELIDCILLKRKISKTDYKKNISSIDYSRIKSIDDVTVSTLEKIQIGLRLNLLNYKFNDPKSKKDVPTEDYGIAYTCRCGNIVSTHFNMLVCELCNTANAYLGGKKLEAEPVIDNEVIAVTECNCKKKNLKLKPVKRKLRTHECDIIHEGYDMIGVPAPISSMMANKLVSEGNAIQLDSDLFEKLKALDEIRAIAKSVDMSIDFNLKVSIGGK